MTDNSSMIIVGMSPARSIYLASRNTYRTKCRYSKRRLFATTTVSRLDRSTRRTGPAVRRCISDFLVTPMIHFQNSILHILAGNTLFQFFIKRSTRVVEILSVDTNRKNEMAEQ